MPDPLPTGKLPPDLLRRLLAAASPLPPEVRLGPAVGEDACAIDVPAGTLVAAADPITLTGSRVGAHAVIVNANDVAVMGVRPRWFLATVLLPRGSAEADVCALFDEMRRALESVGAVLVGGHTEVTDAVSQPLVAGQMLGLAALGAVVSSAGARTGDVIVQAGEAPVEGGAVLAAGAPRQALGAGLRARAIDALERPGISVVEPALAAAELGARALHDPTEGGLATGLHELADAAGLRLRVDETAVLWFAPGVSVCRALGADPWGALASGALLAAFAPERAERACAELARRGHRVRAIARAEPGSGVVCSDGRPLPRYDRDEVARILGDVG